MAPLRRMPRRRGRASEMSSEGPAEARSRSRNEESLSVGRGLSHIFPAKKVL
jgi:hypothetical protein